MKKWSPFPYIRNYRFNSLFLRNFISIEVMVVLPLLLICIVSFCLFQKMYLDDIERNSQNSVCRLQETVDTAVHNVRMAGINLCSEEKILDFLKYPKDLNLSHQGIKCVTELQNMLSKFQNEYVTSIYIYSEENEYVVKGTSALKSWEIYDQSWLELYEKQEKRIGTTVWSRVRMDWKQKEAYPCISIGLFMPYYESYSKNGLLLLNMDNEWIDELSASSGDDYYDFYIIDEKQQIVYNTDYTKLGQKLDNYVDRNASEYLVSEMKSKDTEWTYVYLTNLTRYNERWMGLVFIVIISVICLVLLSTVVSYLVSVRVFLPVKKIMDMIENPKQLLEMEPENDERSELQFITSTFMEFFRKEEQNKQALTNHMVSLKEAQLALLQAQINPHFLFNTLQSINFLAIGLTKSDNTVTTAVNTLSIMMRYMLGEDYKLVTVAKELEYSQAYIKIEQLRFGAQLEVVWNVAPELYDYEMVKVSLQPILENGIKHGFRNMKAPGKITVEAVVKDELLIFTIKDNGIGQSSEWIQEKNIELEEVETILGKHIGIRNVNHRIRLFFGRQYGIRIVEQERGGFAIRMEMPAIQNIEMIKR